MLQHVFANQLMFGHVLPKKLAMEDLEDHVTTETLPGLVNVYSLLLKMAIEIVDLPFQNIKKWWFTETLLFCMFGAVIWFPTICIAFQLS